MTSEERRKEIERLNKICDQCCLDCKESKLCEELCGSAIPWLILATDRAIKEVYSNDR